MCKDNKYSLIKCAKALEYNDINEQNNINKFKIRFNNMYLKRKIDDFLILWKNNPDRKPLIVNGSSQIGKTESIRHFAEKNYESVIEINFVSDNKYKKIISDGYSASFIPEEES